MTFVPHPNEQNLAVACAIVTISDTRTPENDRSGQILREGLENAHHSVNFYTIIPDEPNQIKGLLQQLGARPDIDAIIFNGGTGIAPRDTTYEAIAALLDKNLPGFGEIFRYLSYQEIGSRAMASRALGGVYQNKLIFSLPGSSNAVKLALEKLIVPELNHLVKQIGAKN